MASRSEGGAKRASVSFGRERAAAAPSRARRRHAHPPSVPPPLTIAARGTHAPHLAADEKRPPRERGPPGAVECLQRGVGVRGDGHLVARDWRGAFLVLFECGVVWIECAVVVCVGAERVGLADVCMAQQAAPGGSCGGQQQAGSSRHAVQGTVQCAAHTVAQQRASSLAVQSEIAPVTLNPVPIGWSRYSVPYLRFQRPGLGASEKSRWRKAVCFFVGVVCVRVCACAWRVVERGVTEGK